MSKLSTTYLGLNLKNPVIAGADALQLNMFIVPFDLKKSGQAIDSEYADIVRAVRKEITIPL